MHQYQWNWGSCFASPLVDGDATIARYNISGSSESEEEEEGLAAQHAEAREPKLAR